MSIECLISAGNWRKNGSISSKITFKAASCKKKTWLLVGLSKKYSALLTLSQIFSKCAKNGSMYLEKNAHCVRLVGNVRPMMCNSTGYGHPKRAFLNFWAWADILGKNFLRHLVYFRPNYQHLFWQHCESLVHVFHYSTIISTKN